MLPFGFNRRSSDTVSLGIIYNGMNESKECKKIRSLNQTKYDFMIYKKFSTAMRNKKNIQENKFKNIFSSQELGNICM